VRTLLDDPLADPRLEQQQRQRAVVEHRVVETPDVEALAECRLGLRAQRLALQLPSAGLAELQAYRTAPDTLALVPPLPP